MQDETYITEGYPLVFPIGWKRTKTTERARFHVTFGRARDELVKELTLLGATRIIISSNIPIKRDGTPYANYPEPNDKGVAIYFYLNGQQNCIACDRWNRVVDNMQAINLTVSALRGIKRWSSSDIMNAAFTGFKCLPPPAQEKQYFENITNANDLKKRYRELVFLLHPDKGGNSSEFSIMQTQFNKLLKNMGEM